MLLCPALETLGQRAQLEGRTLRKDGERSGCHGPAACPSIARSNNSARQHAPCANPSVLSAPGRRLAYLHTCVPAQSAQSPNSRPPGRSAAFAPPGPQPKGPWLRAACLRHCNGLRHPPLRACGLLLRHRRHGGRQEADRQARDGHRRRPHGRRYRPGERGGAAPPWRPWGGCPSERAPRCGAGAAGSSLAAAGPRASCRPLGAAPRPRSCYATAGGPGASPGAGAASSAFGCARSEGRRPLLPSLGFQRGRKNGIWCFTLLRWLLGQSTGCLQARKYVITFGKLRAEKETSVLPVTLLLVL